MPVNVKMNDIASFDVHARRYNVEFAKLDKSLEH